MDTQRLRAIILDIEYHLSDEDRRRLHFYVGGAVPRRLRDDPSLAGTLNIMERLIEEGRISENDLTFLIDAFDQIHCMNAVEILKGHLRRNESKELNQSVRDISRIMPHTIINEIDDDQEDKHATNHLIPYQRNNSQDETINDQMQEIDNDETVTSPLTRTRKQKITSSLVIFGKWRLLLELILCIVSGLLVFVCVWYFIENRQSALLPPASMMTNYTQCNNISQKLQHCLKRIEQKVSPRCTSTIDIRLDAKWKKYGITVAGGNERGSGINQLSFPLGLYVHDDQTIYIADTYNHRVMEWILGTASGKVVAGGNGKGNGTNQLNLPWDVVVDKKRDDLIICDYGNQPIIRWPRLNDGGNTSGETILSNVDCGGLTVDENGFLYVVDDGKHEVRRYRMDGSDEKVVAGGNGQGNGTHQLSSPWYIFVDRDHSVYVSDSRNNRVMKWEEGAKEGIIVAGGNGPGFSRTQLDGPKGIFVDQMGSVYVIDQGNYRIMRWPKGSKLGTVIAGNHIRGGQSNQFSSPTVLSLDQHGNLYVADWENNRIQKFDIKKTKN